jgi:hypothetical protein
LTASIQAQSWVKMPMPNQQRRRGRDYVIHPDELKKLGRATGEDAIEAIVQGARATRIVILNEDHNQPRDRAFAWQVAKALRPLGYDLLAVETLTNVPDSQEWSRRMRQLVADGYVRESTGTYTRDPVFADFLRHGLALGYRPIAYEQTRNETFADPEEDIAQREQDQARNIIDRALAPYPNSKLLIYVGFSHAAEEPLHSASGKQRLWLAARLKRMTGIDPLTIDQTTFADPPALVPNVDIYELASPKAGRSSIVLKIGSRPLVVGPYAGAVDLQVVHPRLPTIGGRPAWLSQMDRRPVAIPRQLLPKKGHRIIQAFIASEGPDAIPVDQVVATAGVRPPPLMLPKREIRYEVADCQ